MNDDIEVDLEVVEAAQNRVEELIGELPKTTCSGPTVFKSLKITKVEE